MLILDHIKMATFNPDSFQRALDRFKRSLSPSLAEEFSVCSLLDVRNTIRDIQQKQSEEGKLRYMRRLMAFIEAMEQFGKVIEVFVNVNVFVGFVWVRHRSIYEVRPPLMLKLRRGPSNLSSL